MLPVESSVKVVLGAAVTADFKLEWISPGPVRLESKFSGEVNDKLPIDGRNYLSAGQLEPGVQAVDGRILIRARVGFNRSRSTANWDARRTTTWMKSRRWMRPGA